MDKYLVAIYFIDAPHTPSNIACYEEVEAYTSNGAIKAAFKLHPMFVGNMSDAEAIKL